MECPVANLWKKVFYCTDVRSLHPIDCTQADWMMRLCLRIVLCADAEEILSAMSEQNDPSKLLIDCAIDR